MDRIRASIHEHKITSGSVYFLRRNSGAPQSAKIAVRLPCTNRADVTPDSSPTTTPAHPQPIINHVYQVQPTISPQAKAPQYLVLQNQESDREEIGRDDFRKSTYVK